jgi:hypothetical protein
MVAKPVEVFFARQSRPEEYREQGDERLINAYAEMMGEGRDAKMRVRMSPGLTNFATAVNDIACRGAILSGDNVYAVFETGVYKINSAGTRTSIGSISGTGPVTMALNSNGQIGIVNRTGRYYLIVSDVIQQINTVDIGAFNSICWIGGYFVLTLPNGRFFSTGLNDGTVISGLDYATAEGSPDGLLGGTALGSELWLFGTETIEVWAPQSNPPATGSPFTRQSSSWINKGCLSFASIVLADNTLFWVGNDRIVYRNANYTPLRISHEGVERAIKAAADPSSIRGGTYTIDGHAFYVISCPEFTWVFDIKEQRWHERKSKNLNRWKADVFINAFGKWLVGTVDDGNLYEIDMGTTLEGSDLMVTTIRSVFMGSYPSRAIIYAIEFTLISGRASLTGTVPQTAPMWELRYSDDGGANWSMSRQLQLGGQGEYAIRCVATRLGRTGRKWGRIWELTGSDPHPRSLTRIVMNVESLAA